MGAPAACRSRKRLSNDTGSRIGGGGTADNTAEFVSGDGCCGGIIGGKNTDGLYDSLDIVFFGRVLECKSVSMFGREEVGLRGLLRLVADGSQG